MVYNNAMKRIVCDNPDWMLFDCSTRLEDVFMVAQFALPVIALTAFIPSGFRVLVIVVGMLGLFGGGVFLGFSHHGILIDRSGGIATDWREVFGWRYFKRDYPLNKFSKVNVPDSYQNHGGIHLIAISGDLSLGTADNPEDAHAFGSAIAEFLHIRYHNERLWMAAIETRV